jgi:hypothetical protein
MNASRQNNCHNVALPQKSLHLILPNLQVGVKYHLESGTILMVFPGRRLKSISRCSFKRPTSQDLDPFSTGRISGPGKTIEMVRNFNDAEPQPKVGENEMKDF